MFPLPVRVLWPESLQWLFPGGGDGAFEAYFHQWQMQRVATHSDQDLQGALQAAQNLARRYVTQRTTWLGFVDFFPDRITRGDQFALAEAAKHGAPCVASLQAAWHSPGWDTRLKAPRALTRAWGPIGLFWAMLLEQLESRRPYRSCKWCGRFLQGKKTQCYPEDNPLCHARWRRADKARERARRTAE
jgi:hypothetical protein